MPKNLKNTVEINSIQYGRWSHRTQRYTSYMNMNIIVKLMILGEAVHGTNNQCGLQRTYVCLGSKYGKISN